MPKSRFDARTDFASFNPALLEAFHTFAEHGEASYTFPNRRQAIGLRTKLYRARVMMQKQAEAGDPNARELIRSAQHLYIEMHGDEPCTVRLILDPITRIVWGDKLPWKEQRNDP